MTLADVWLLQQKKLEDTFPDLRFKVDKKADSKYKPVSAASVCAKVTRDIAVKEWKFSENENVDMGPVRNWGSGYPAGGYSINVMRKFVIGSNWLRTAMNMFLMIDPVTKRFLRKNIDPVFGFPNIVRNSWSTASGLLEKCAVKVKW